VGIVALALALHVSVAARQLQPGELFLMTITSSAPCHHVRVRAFDAELMPFAAGDREWRVLGGVDLAVRPGTYAVEIDADDAHSTYQLLVRAKAFPTRRLRVDEAFVTPPASAAARIKREAEQLDRIWRAPTPERLWADPFLAPVPQASNSAFGTRSVFNGRPRNRHSGADFPSPSGTPVHAPNAGRIVVAEDLYYSGNTVVIDHGLGLFSMLAHLSETDVRAGDLVKAGQTVGRVGATGRVTGPHLHWGVRAAGARVDPISLLALLGPG
jgi:murein DD-endopeptidase MepM/ murein hydrolase activator NlpD